MPDPVAETLSKAAAPNYENLIRFLVQPFLESPAALKLDCEVSQSRARVWIRLAFEGSDKGRVFGRGGRNIQAIRTVLEAIAKLAGHSIHLDVYGGPPGYSNDGSERENSPERPNSRRPSSRGSSRPRSR
ncbi:MAG: KH domain-containing protein [Leptolyngbyaceae cyanobacterium RU_5_1]|nr:KH domain-containing protein [Leptolyngbyaceae cyanobacterium RU_5_1]